MGGSYHSVMKPFRLLQMRLLRAISGADYLASAELNFNACIIYVFKSLCGFRPSNFQWRLRTSHFTKE